MLKNLLIILVAAMAFTSCVTTKKNISSHLVKSDSLGESSSFKKGISTSDSIGVNEKDSSYQNDISIEFDNDSIIHGTIFSNDSNGVEDPVQKANELAGPKGGTAVHTVIVNGQSISSNRPIKRIKFHDAGQLKEMNITSEHKKDSGQVEVKNKTVLQKEEKSKEKVVHRSTMGSWWIIMALVIGAIVYLRVALSYMWFPFTLLGKLKKND